MFDVGIPELVLILVVALVVFGPGKLPEVGASIGKAMREFRKATQSVTDEIESVTGSVTSLTKLESEDEMRTRLITEQNRKREAAAAAMEPAATAAIAPVSPQFETPAPAAGETVAPAPAEAVASVMGEPATTIETSLSEPATMTAENAELSRISRSAIQLIGLTIFMLATACGGPPAAPGAAATATAAAQPSPTLTPSVLLPAQVLSITPLPLGTPGKASTAPATPAASLTVDAKTSVPILMYHQIKLLTASATQDDLAWTVTPDALDAQLGYLAEKGYTTINLDQLLDGYAGRTALPAKAVVITFDDGWKTQYTVGLPLLKKYKQTATFYVVTTYMGYGAYFDWDMTKALKDAGMTIAGHTLDHSDLVKQNATQLAKQLGDSKAALEKNLGITVSHFAYPYGSYNDTVVAAVKRAGYRSAATIDPVPVKSPVSPFLLPRMHASYKLTLAEFIKMLP